MLGCSFFLLFCSSLAGDATKEVSVLALVLLQGLLASALVREATYKLGDERISNGESLEMPFAFGSVTVFTANFTGSGVSLCPYTNIHTHSSRELYNSREFWRLRECPEEYSAFHEPWWTLINCA